MVLYIQLNFFTVWTLKKILFEMEQNITTVIILFLYTNFFCLEKFYLITVICDKYI